MAGQNTPYIVLLGKVGSGKSTIVEKVTGEKGRAADVSMSDTRQSEPLWSLQGEFIISDTPGSNAMKDKFEHNVWIATAFNFRPVSKIFIVVKADAGRIDGIIDEIYEYSDRFIELPDVPLGILITHMDKISWSSSDQGHEIDLRKVIMEEVQIEDVIFSSPASTSQTLIANMLRTCTDKIDLRVDHDNFLRLFTNLQKRNPKARDILRHIKNEVEEFIAKREEFYAVRRNYDRKQQVDLVFEFQAFMTQEITKAQKRLSDQLEFSFDGANADDEAAHIGNMSNQMIGELRKIRTEALNYQSDHGASQLRKCPHCGQAWTKVEGCEDETVCGERPEAPNDTRNEDFVNMATYSFRWDQIAKRLIITKTGIKSAQNISSSGYGVGCGKPITWKHMADIEVPPEFDPVIAAVKTTDVALLPATASNFNEKLDDRLNKNLSKLSLKPKPALKQRPTVKR